jgi:hypothetical protein
MEQNTTDRKDERHEKKDEKERDEKFRNDPLSAMAWAAVLIWAGVVLLVQTLLPAMADGREPWGPIAIGAGVIFLLEALIRTVRPEYRRPIGGTLIFAVILIAGGLSALFAWEAIGPIALIVIGTGLLLATLLRRR